MAITRKKFLIDCDTGVDDCYALMLAMSKRDIADVVAITCVNGNVDLDQVCMNTLRTVKAMDLLDEIPVYRGCKDPLVVLPTRVNASMFHGQDGLGNVPNVEPKPTAELYSNLQEEHAALVISRLSKKYKNELEIICLGPLTNIAVALRLDPELPKRIKRLHILGGTSRGYGNITAAAEFNFFVDPEAVHIVISDFSPLCEIYLITYETALDSLIEWDWFDDFLNNGQEFKRNFLKEISRYKIAFAKKNETGHESGNALCDAYIVCCALDPAAIVKSTVMEVGVELGGILSRGGMILERRGVLGNDKYLLGKVTLIEKVNKESLKSVLSDVLK